MKSIIVYKADDLEQTANAKPFEAVPLEAAENLLSACKEAKAVLMLLNVRYVLFDDKDSITETIQLLDSTIKQVEGE
jgi:hypothetical protein